MAITIYDVAREANVSMATVSRVLNGNPNVKPETRRKVKDVIERLNYKPNAVARGLASKKTKTVGVIIPDISDLYYSAVLRGLEDIAEMYQYQIIITNTDNDAKKEKNAFETLLSNQVDGIIFLGGTDDQKIIDNIQRSNTPVVICGYSKEMSINRVNANYRDAISRIVEEFIERGNKKIAYVQSGYHSVLENILADKICEVLEEHNISKDNMFEFSANTYEEGIELFNKIHEVKADAVIAISDEVAGGILHGTLDKNVKVPEELEIISCSNTRIAYMMRPKLSTIAVPLYDIGAVGMRLLTKIMNNEEVDEKVTMLPLKINYAKTTRV